MNSETRGVVPKWVPDPWGWGSTPGQREPVGNRCGGDQDPFNSNRWALIKYSISGDAASGGGR